MDEENEFLVDGLIYQFLRGQIVGKSAAICLNSKTRWGFVFRQLSLVAWTSAEL